ncbi:MAG: hypothetical protein V2B19_29265 [Pseudomonadota bacterium]
MNQNASMPSLLPYLEPNDAKIRLDITGASPNPPETTPNRFPFRVLNESSPLTRLLRADILSDADSLIQPVFLIVQKDTYRYQPSELWPLTNLDVEDCWQRTHTLFSEAPSGKPSPEAMGHDIIRLKDAAATGGNRNAFQSLFFCSHRRVFFHPPCPGCGRELVLCKDDSLLLSRGLSAYSSSLRRYLYCPSCPPVDEGNGFYVSALESADSKGVRDGIGLILAWRHLLAGGLAPAGFPCLNCPERTPCHGPENLSAMRITPFGFYPFHLRVVKAMTIRAADFLPLVSGARIADIEKRLRERNEPERLSAVIELRRMVGEKDLFFFDGTEKHFLEILYLKLSFLNEITEMIRTGPAPLDINAALDCLWVKIPRQAGLLPGLWNFSVGYMDIALTRNAAFGRPGANEAQLNYFLGLIWFHFLLTNASRPAAAVTAALSGILQNNEGTGGDMFDAPLFAPENIFWNPGTHDAKQFPFEWRGLWKKTLGLALNLFTLDRPGAAGASDNIRRELSTLRNELRQQLFFDGGAQAIVTSDESDDRRIHQILTGIIGKWETTFPPAQPGRPPLKEPREETVLITRSKIDETLWDSETTVQTIRKIPEPSEDTETTIQSRGSVPEPPRELETIIQSRGSASEPPRELETIIQSRGSVPGPPRELETIIQSRGSVPGPPRELETIIQSRGSVPAASGEAETILQTVGAPPDTTAEAETVMLTRGKVEEALQQTVIITKNKVDDELEKTVLISKTKTGASVVPPPLSPREKIDDGLSETVVLSGKTTGRPPLFSPSAPLVKPPEADDEEGGESDLILSETIILRSPPK